MESLCDAGGGLLANVAEFLHLTERGPLAVRKGADERIPIHPFLVYPINNLGFVNRINTAVTALNS